MHKTRPGRAPSIPRGGGVPTTGKVPPAAARRFSAASPTPQSYFPSPGLTLTRCHRGFTRIRPSGLPLACSPRMERRPLGFDPELRTPPLPAAHVRAGTDAEHSPGATSSAPILHSTRPLDACNLVSQHLGSALLVRNCDREKPQSPLPGGRHRGSCPNHQATYCKARAKGPTRLPIRASPTTASGSR
jgi:hypothetical protein